MSSNTIGSREALAAAVAAWQINGNEYLKAKEWEPGVGNIKRWENKEIVRRFFSLDYYSTGAISPPAINLTEDHYRIADDMIQYSKKLLFKVLAADPNNHDYEVVLYQRMNQPTITLNDLGYIASAPLYYYNQLRKNYVRDKLENGTNQHVGTLNGTVVLNNFEVIRNSWSNKFQGSVVQGLCDDNLFLFFTNKNVAHLKPGDKINLKGRVKDHILEKDIYPMTKLNYVHIEGIKDETPSTTRQISDSNLF